MPELPEVETVRRGLQELVVGLTIAEISSDSPKSLQASPDDLRGFVLGAHITEVRRRAKVLMIDLSSGHSLVVHLKMTGQLVYRGEKSFGAGHPNGSLVGALPDRSTRAIIRFTDGSHLFFNDQRKFGWMRLFPTLEVPNIDFMKKVGPEPLDADFLPEAFAERFSRRAGTSIKAALLDQTVVAGVGNIYADESLWAARIHPKRLVKTITPKEFENLFHELRSVMTTAIEKGGSTDKNYVNADGGRGNYLDFARVFRREGHACPRCSTMIIKFKAAGRGTHICPVCQTEQQ